MGSEGRNGNRGGADWRRWRKTILAFVLAAVLLGGVVALLLFGGT